jgi:hypothetical protein
VSDSDLRQALLGTWRLVSAEDDEDGKVFKPYGDSSLPAQASRLK